MKTAKQFAWPAYLSFVIKLLAAAKIDCMVLLTLEAEISGHRDSASTNDPFEP